MWWVQGKWKLVEASSRLRFSVGPTRTVGRWGDASFDCGMGVKVKWWQRLLPFTSHSLCCFKSRLWISHLMLWLHGLEFHSWPLWFLTQPWPVQTSQLSCQSRSDLAERAVHCKAYTSESFFWLIFYWIQILQNIELPRIEKNNAILLILYGEQ